MDLGVGHLERSRTDYVERGFFVYVSNNYFERVVMSKKSIDYKFNEDKLISEFSSYIDSTYNQHYAKEKFQATEFIIDGGHGTGFCIGNVLKYAQRYGKKGSDKDARKDLMKVLHYALIQLHVHDNN